MSFETIIATIFFFLPAYIANAIPPLLHKMNILPKLAIPIDNNKTFRGEPLFGTHKTWRGAIGIFIIGILLSPLFFEINKHVELYEVISFSYFNPYLFGALLSLGIIIGDLSFAFVKRQIKLKPGAPFIPFDQTNYVFGTFVVLEPFINLGLGIWLIIFIQTFIIHSVFNRIGYVLGLHNAKW
ncbi:MAG: CDP-archaeol synthase [Candidatus Pacebacteria bacterium]|nr:CDP-archaeol synthase [Candidatus Paceibacterota bacterium]